MFDGKTFLPLQGTPIPLIARSSTRFADWLPEPLTVPTRIARSLTRRRDDASSAPTERVRTEERTIDMMSLVNAGTTAGFTRIPPRRRHSDADPVESIGERFAYVDALIYLLVDHTSASIARELPV